MTTNAILRNTTGTIFNTRRGRLVLAGLASASLAFAGGCNNAGEGAVSGAAIGALAGLGIGSLTGNAGAGAAIGAIGGGVGGAVLGDQNKRKRENAYIESGRGGYYDDGDRYRQY